MISEASFDPQLNYQEEVKILAIKIYNEFLRTNATNKVNVDEAILCQIYEKFGCDLNQNHLSQHFNVLVRSNKLNGSTSTNMFNTNTIHEEILITNLNQALFQELYKHTLKGLELAFQMF